MKRAGFRAVLAAVVAVSAAFPAMAQDGEPTPAEERLRKDHKLTAPPDERGGTYRNARDSKRDDDGTVRPDDEKREDDGKDEEERRERQEKR